MMAAAPDRMTWRACSSGTRTATPSAKVDAGLVGTTLPSLEGQSVGIRAVGDDAHDVGEETKQISGPDQPTDTRAQADRSINRVEVTIGLEQFARIGRDANNEIWVEGRHELVAALLCDLRGSLSCVI